jgi:translation initiation factor 3 subunit C
MSRFFRQASSDSDESSISNDSDSINKKRFGLLAVQSDSDSSESSYQSSESESETEKPKLQRATYESDSEDEKRVVRSHKDKRFDELRQICNVISNGKKINDWTLINNGILFRGRLTLCRI